MAISPSDLTVPPSAEPLVLPTTEPVKCGAMVSVMCSLLGGAILKKERSLAKGQCCCCRDFLVGFEHGHLEGDEPS